MIRNPRILQDNGGLWYAGRVRGVLALLAVALLASCAPTPAEDEASFLQDVQAFRAAKDQAFLQPDSPVPADKRSTLLPLAWTIPQAPAYRVPAVLRVSTGTRHHRDAHLDGPATTTCARSGRSSSACAGEPLSLGAFVEDGSAT